jgi:hypothetical protein
MNSNNIAPRILSFAMAALLTATMLAGIDTLAHTEHAANDLMARTAPVADRPA